MNFFFITFKKIGLGVIVVITVIGMIACFPKQKLPPLPEGWRWATQEELAGNSLRDLAVKESQQEFISAQGDFNGDGTIDQAFLVRSTVFNGQALLVKLSNPEGFTWIDLHRIDWGDQPSPTPLQRGISTLEAGQHLTACGKGYWECGEGEEPVLVLDHPAISYFQWGSAGSLFYWNPDPNHQGEDKEVPHSFKEVWLSD